MKKEKMLTLTQAARTVGIGRNTLLQKLRDSGLLCDQAPMRNSPTKHAVEEHLLFPKCTQYLRGSVQVQHITALVTAKGMVWIRSLIDSEITEKAANSN
ncbi:phage antirepressor KilAC domain-containing protein [Microbulbifer sp. 2201CG32-9]|uniref:phage antirepressor KilAC domain-containing protein n=1 Tax=Microbulbifer sp. 2201CG32-9 TaxID=3232309 RepID=UPI00345B9FF4